MNKLKLITLSICLMVININCKSTATAPEVPRPPMWQPIVDQEFCYSPTAGLLCIGEKECANFQSEISACERKSLCREYRFDGSTQDYYLYQTHELKACSGILGVTSDWYTELRKYFIEMGDWVKNNCKVKK